MTRPLATSDAESWDRLVRHCAALPDPVQMSTEDMVAYLHERQQVLDAVQKLEVARLSGVKKAELKERLQRVEAHGEALRTELQARLRTLQNHRGQVVQGRGALRGYSPQIHRKSRTVNRSA